VVARSTVPLRSAKYGNVLTASADGKTFASKREARRYGELLLRERAGEIVGLATQVPFDLLVNGIKVCRYVADFVYFEGERYVVEDSKGCKTAVYRLKRKLMLAVHGIEIRET
jgi:Protein of unknown function (DUF1064)